MNDNIAIKVNHVSKYFKLPTEPTHSLRRSVVNRFKGIKGYRKQEVLKDISFEIEKGDFFGIVGRNGSGKSTLLKIISKIYKPNSGEVEINGRLVSFIELGVGFNEELSGRENVYLNGAMLGFSHDEITEMYDEIVEFSELQDFMDQKLKNYSSGMQVRLAFSIAIMTDSDILILDEVLAVGDEAFQKKCRDYFKKVRKEGKTVILVTHDMASVREYCTKAMLLNNGEIVLKSEEVDTVALKYSELFVSEQLVNEDPLRMGNHKVTIEDYKHRFDSQRHYISFTVLNHTAHDYDRDVDVFFEIFQDANKVAGNHLFFGEDLGLSLKQNGSKQIELEFPNQFGKGDFTIDISLKTDRDRELLDMIRLASTFTNIYAANSISTNTIEFKLRDMSTALEFSYHTGDRKITTSL